MQLTFVDGVVTLKYIGILCLLIFAFLGFKTWQSKQGDKIPEESRIIANMPLPEIDLVDPEAFSPQQHGMAYLEPGSWNIWIDLSRAHGELSDKELMSSQVLLVTLDLTYLFLNRPDIQYEIEPVISTIDVPVLGSRWPNYRLYRQETQETLAKEANRKLKGNRNKHIDQWRKALVSLALGDSGLPEAFMEQQFYGLGDLLIHFNEGPKQRTILITMSGGQVVLMDIGSSTRRILDSGPTGEVSMRSLFIRYVNRVGLFNNSPS